MMTDYAAFYQALELSPGAAPEEVKRAYFRLLRQYSPETHPEEFKRIRAAYEALKDGPHEVEKPPFPMPTNSFLQTALEMCAMHNRDGDYEAAASAYESLMKISPDEPYVLLGLANSQRLAGHPQKAAKTALRLAELRPDSRDAWRIAATETYSRGWYKKALPLFRKAFGLGEKRLDFLTDYAAAAADNGEYEESDRVNREIIKTEKWNKDNAEYAVQAYLSLAENTQTHKDALRMLDNYAAFLPGCRRLPLDVSDLTSPIAALYYHAEYLMEDLEVYRKADQCLALVMKMRDAGKDSFPDKLRITMLYGAMKADDRFTSDVWWGLAEATYSDRGMFPSIRDKPDVQASAMLDTQLCLLKQDPDAFRRCAALLEREYSYLYEPNRAFFDEALTGDREAMFERLKRQFLKVYYKYEGSNFQSRYPEELPSLYRETRVHGDSQPYVREGKKVGRNNPCPCGSGKKFKKCCMGKGIYD